MGRPGFGDAAPLMKLQKTTPLAESAEAWLEVPKEVAVNGNVIVVKSPLAA
jgi:hypothetical protein